MVDDYVPLGTAVTDGRCDVLSSLSNADSVVVFILCTTEKGLWGGTSADIRLNHAA